jgi:hypothetical protein
MNDNMRIVIWSVCIGVLSYLLMKRAESLGWDRHWQLVRDQDENEREFQEAEAADEDRKKLAELHGMVKARLAKDDASK